MDGIQAIFLLYKIVSSELVLVLIGIGIGGPVYSSGGSHLSFVRKCEMGPPSII
jgi:hypothetical protein